MIFSSHWMFVAGCPDPLAAPGVLYPNYIGAFCHKWFASRWSTCDVTQTSPRCCGLFNGGANAGRDKYPFPEYLVLLFGRGIFGWPNFGTFGTTK